MSNTLSYYVGGNTAEGFVNFLPSNVKDFHHVIILKHPSNTLKTKIIANVIEQYKQNHNLEVLLSPLGSDYLDGVIIKDKSVAVIVQQLATENLPGAIEVDLNLFVAEEIPTNGIYQEALKQFQNRTEEGYKNLDIGLKVHDDLEKVYINQMNFKRANELAEEFIGNLLDEKPKQDEQGKLYERLFGTNTKEGVVNVVPELLKQQKNNYFIKGRAGTGKSTFMKKIKTACLEHGYDVELYHCSFDPNSIDMVLVRDLDFCIFDSTDPHEFFPERQGDQIVDLYEELVTPGTDEKYATEIDMLNRDYKTYAKKGVVNLKEAGVHLEEAEQHFTFTDQEVDRITTFILEKIVQ